MDYKFKDWQKALADFQKDVEKELTEIRQHKAEIQLIKKELLDELSKGRYVRDDARLILSAPEIVIGNVDPTGALYEGQGSSVVIRGTKVGVEGAGEGGAVIVRATNISQQAVDPGSDGLESVVWPVSQISSQARSIVLQSNDDVDYFSDIPASVGASGVRIHADEHVEIEAAVGSDTTKERLDAVIKMLEDKKKELTTESNNHKSSLDELVKDLEKLLEDNAKLGDSEKEIRSNYADMAANNRVFCTMATTLSENVSQYADVLSQLAETNRQLKTVKTQKGAIKSGDDYKKKLTGASIDIKGEIIKVASADGDGNLRDNDGAGLTVTANDMLLQAIEADRKLKEKGKMTVNVMNFELSTADNADEKYEKGKLKGGTYEAKGDVTIKSKNITMESVDYELKDDKMQEKALTKEGSFKLRAEKMDLSATDTEGKATGSLAMNAKAVSLRSMDVEKEKRTDDKLAAGSTMLLVSENMYVGAKSKDVKSKKVQAVSEEMGLFADKTLETQQGDGKAMLQLADGKAAFGGSETQVYGKTTINAATEVKAELKVPKATIDNVEAKSSFKSPNISDGIAVPAAPSSAKLSAKLKTEDAPKE